MIKKLWGMIPTNVRIGLASFLFGVVVTSGVALYITRTSGKVGDVRISNETISGYPLLPKQTQTVNHSTVIDYSYAGQGESKVTIPWDSNPWGYNWSRKTWMITSDLNYFGKEASLLLSKRFSTVVLGVGARYDWNNAKVYPIISASYIFEL
jgi:hypothetical protein